MRNYIEKLYTVSEFKRDNSELSNQGEKALQYLKGHCPNSEDATFVVIEVESYHCIACLTDKFAPYTLGTTIAPHSSIKTEFTPFRGLQHNTLSKDINSEGT